jgi:hypothetical protein
MWRNHFITEFPIIIVTGDLIDTCSRIWSSFYCINCRIWVVYVQKEGDDAWNDTIEKGVRKKKERDMGDNLPVSIERRDGVCSKYRCRKNNITLSCVVVIQFVVS